MAQRRKKKLMSDNPRRFERKTAQDVKVYKETLDRVLCDSTFPDRNGDLCGSTEMGEPIDSQPLTFSEKVQRKSFRYIIKDYIHNHWLECVLTLIVAPLFAWMLCTCYTQNAEIKVLEEKSSVAYTNLDRLEIQFDDISEGFVSREYFDIQIELLRNEIANASSIKEIQLLQKEIDLLSKQLEKIEIK